MTISEVEEEGELDDEGVPDDVVPGGEHLLGESEADALVVVLAGRGPLPVELAAQHAGVPDARLDVLHVVRPLVQHRDAHLVAERPLEVGVVLALGQAHVQVDVLAVALPREHSHVHLVAARRDVETGAAHRAARLPALQLVGHVPHAPVVREHALLAAAAVVDVRRRRHEVDAAVVQLDLRVACEFVLPVGGVRQAGRLRRRHRLLIAALTRRRVSTSAEICHTKIITLKSCFFQKSYYSRVFNFAVYIQSQKEIKN